MAYLTRTYPAERKDWSHEHWEAAIQDMMQMLQNQQNTTGTASGFTAGGGTAVNDQSTFTGNLGSTAYRISDIVRALKQVGILAQ